MTQAIGSSPSTKALALSSSIIILPAAFVAGFAYILWQKRSWLWTGKYLAHFAVLFVCIFLLIALFYALHARNMETEKLAQQVAGSYPGEFPEAGREVLSSLAAGNPAAKGLAEYLNGMLMVFGRMEGAAQTIYFMGAVYGSEGAGPLYFPILYLTKMPVGLLALNLSALIGMLAYFFRAKKRLRDIHQLQLAGLISLAEIARPPASADESERWR